MKSRLLKGLLGGLALISLAAPILFFLGRITEGSFKTTFLVASIGWFVFAVARGSSGKSPAAG